LLSGKKAKKPSELHADIDFSSPSAPFASVRRNLYVCFYLLLGLLCVFAERKSGISVRSEREI
jgi:hypothetical protein